MAELTRLLGFMSSWDRQAVLEKYEALFAAAEDPDALTEELGTPTKLAIDLAATYVPTPAPRRQPRRKRRKRFRSSLLSRWSPRGRSRRLNRRPWSGRAPAR